MLHSIKIETFFIFSCHKAIAAPESLKQDVGHWI